MNNASGAEQQTQFPTIPGYEILELLGKGSSGTVYKARQLALDRYVAIKVLHRQLASQTKYLQRLQREAKLTSRLDHANVVKGIDYGNVEGSPYFVMEYAEGKTLKAILKEKGRFSEAEAIDIALQIANALEHAYRHGIVHRDVKPGNIILSPEGVAKLTDLGLARRPGDPTVTLQGSTMGTPQYISPEQARNPSSVDVRSDIYSLGATLFHLVTGSPPFAGESLADLLTKVLFEIAQSASEREPSVSPGFSLVLRKMLAKDPERRYQTAGELIEDLNRVKNHLEPAVSEKALTEKKPESWTLRVSLMAAVVLVSGFILWRLWKPEERVNPVSENPLQIEMVTLQPSADISFGELLSRHRRLEQLLESAAYPPEQKSSLENLRDQTKAAIRVRIKTATDAGTQQTLEAWQRHQYRELERRIQRSMAGLFEEELGMPLERARQRDALVGEEWDSWVAREKRSFDERMKKKTADFEEEVQRKLTSLRMQALDLNAAHQFRAAQEKLLLSLSQLRDADGDRVEDLPESWSGVASVVNRFEREISAKILADAGELADHVLNELEQLKQSSLKAFRVGWGKPVERQFDEDLSALFARWKLKPSELPLEVEGKIEKAVMIARGELLQKEQSFQREAALRVIADFDEEFAPLIRQRDYEKALEEWKKLEGKESLAAAAGEIQNHLRELRSLVDLREAFASALDRSPSQVLQVREGSIWKVGKAVGGFDRRTGKFQLEPEKGPALICSFSTVHPETVGRLCGFLDSQTGKELEGLSSAQLFQWALFQLYEGNFSYARSLVNRLTQYKEYQSWVGPALARIQMIEGIANAQGKQKEKTAQETLDSARRFALVGEWDRSQAKFQSLLRNFADAELVRASRSSLEEELNQVTETAKAAQKTAALQAAFPGAEILPLRENRLSLHYRFRDRLPAGWRASDSWIESEGGVRRRARCENASDFKLGSGPQLSLPVLWNAGVRVSFRLTFPYELGAPLFSSFSAGGVTFAVLSGGEAKEGQFALWAGGPESYESHFQRPGATAESGSTLKRFRFFRGGSYEVTIEILPGGREAVCRVDGEEIARLKFGEPSPAVRDRIEFRSWEIAELREVWVEGSQGVVK